MGRVRQIGYALQPVAGGVRRVVGVLYASHDVRLARGTRPVAEPCRRYPGGQWRRRRRAWNSAGLPGDPSRRGMVGRTESRFTDGRKAGSVVPQ